MLRIFDQLGDYDWTAELATLSTPTAIWHGDCDPVPLSGSELWCETLPDATLEVLTGIGHMPWLECPQQYLDPVADFLANATS